MRILLLGYGGANNTGAEIRILTIIDDVRAVFGRDARISVATVDPAKTTQVLQGIDCIEIVRIPYVFPAAIWRLAARHDILMLVEGSTFKQNWSAALLYMFLWAAWCAHLHGRRCVAYAVDAGELTPINRWLTRHVCARIDLIITRTEAARQQLRRFGIERPVNVTTDTAFQFVGSGKSLPWSGKVLGVAPVEFHVWPVRVRLWGDSAQCYHWPYYYSWDETRVARSNNLVQAWAATVRRAIAQGWRVRVIAMEELDRRICQRIIAELSEAERAHVETLFAGEHTPQAIVGALRQLGCLITSRYHACVLSMAGHVPVAALHHDERLRAVMNELGLEEFGISHTTPELSSALPALFDKMIASANWQRDVIAERHAGYFQPRCLENRRILTDWRSSAFPAVADAP